MITSTEGSPRLSRQAGNSKALAQIARCVRPRLPLSAIDNLYPFSLLPSPPPSWNDAGHERLHLISSRNFDLGQTL